MKTGNTPGRPGRPAPHRRASMEPGHEDREYGPVTGLDVTQDASPQWSPVMKTGNTCGRTG